MTQPVIQPQPQASPGSASASSTKGASKLDSHQTPASLSHSLKNLSATLLGIFHTRLSLFGLELAQEKSRLISLLLLVSGALLFIALGILVFSLAAVVLFWDSHPVVALVVLGSIYLVLGLLLCWQLRSHLAQFTIPFESTLQELEQDKAWLTSHKADQYD